MTLDKIGKIFGILIVLAGVTRMMMTPTGLIWGTDSTQELVFGFTASLLMTVATIGTFLVQRESGVLGFVTTIFIIIFNAITACMVWMLLATGMTGDEAMKMANNEFVMISKTLMMAGMFLGIPGFTYATFRAKVFPRWVIYLLVLSIVGPMIPGLELWGALFWGLSYVGMGYVMVTGNYNKTAPLNKSITA